MPMRLFRHKQYESIAVCAAIGSMIYYGGTVPWPVMIAALFTTSVSKIGWLSCAVGGGTLLGQVLGGFGIRYIPRMEIQMVVAGAIMMAFGAAYASATPGAEGRTTAFVSISTTACGYIENLALSSMAFIWKPDDIGLVAGVLSCIRTTAGALIVSMFSSILDTELNKHLPGLVAPVAVQAGLPEDSVPALLAASRSGTIDAVPGITEDIMQAVASALQHAYTLAFRSV